MGWRDDYYFTPVNLAFKDIYKALEEREINTNFVTYPNTFSVLDIDDVYALLNKILSSDNGSYLYFNESGEISYWDIFITRYYYTYKRYYPSIDRLQEIINYINKVTLYFPSNITIDREYYVKKFYAYYDDLKKHLTDFHEIGTAYTKTETEDFWGNYRDYKKLISAVSTVADNRVGTDMEYTITLYMPKSFTLNVETLKKMPQKLKCKLKAEEDDFNTNYPNYFPYWDRTDNYIELPINTPVLLENYEEAMDTFSKQWENMRWYNYVLPGGSDLAPTLQINRCNSYIDLTDQLEYK